MTPHNDNDPNGWEIFASVDEYGVIATRQRTHRGQLQVQSAFGTSRERAFRALAEQKPPCRNWGQILIWGAVLVVMAGSLLPLAFMIA